jgi:hypothetical protein
MPKRGTLLPRIAGASGTACAAWRGSAVVGPTPRRQKIGNSSATSHRAAAGPGRARGQRAAPAARRGGPGPLRVVGARAGEASRRDMPLGIAEPLDPQRTRRPTLLDTPRPCDMLARWKRNGIPIGCEPASTSLRAQASGLRPQRSGDLRESPGKAGAPAMGQREAAFHGALAERSARPRTRLRQAVSSLKRARSFPRSLEARFQAATGGCGMRIAEHLGEAPASHGNRWPTEEIA